jgi:two-component system phosphate regulon sensor histidine kinase PhoR
VFDKFYRVPSNLVHNTKGTGLGLSIVSQIINAHGGKIEVKSEIDKGSTFTLSFPIEKK